MTDEDDDDAPRGKVITFYSYKGGVGRSMALANVAALLALGNHKVLIVDWDLEAPGIERYFHGYLLAERASTDGVVDIMHALGQGRELSWGESLIKVRIDEANLDILSAGRQDDGYATRLSEISWETLFKERDLGRRLERLRNEWRKRYDFVLIDSRTGITDIGGICAIHLPDILVAMFTANEQSLGGVARTLRSARREHDALPVDRTRLMVVPIPARDESLSEHQKAKEWHARFGEELKEFYSEWLPSTVRPVDALEVMRVPYKAYWSFGEPLPVIEEGASAPGTVGFSYALLASLLENDLDWAVMSGGRFATREATPASGGVPRWPLWGAAFVCALLFVIVAALKLGGTGARSPVDRSADAAVGPGESILRRERLLARASSVDDPLLRALILREIPEDVFPSTEVRKALKTSWLPEAVFRGAFTNARFDRGGNSVALSSNDVVVVAASSGVGPYRTIRSGAPPLDLAFLGSSRTARGGRAIVIADRGGVTIEEDPIQYFAEHVPALVTSVESDDGDRVFVVGGPNGELGTRNAIFEIDMEKAIVRRLWDARDPIVAIAYEDDLLAFATTKGSVATIDGQGRIAEIVAFPSAVSVGALGKHWLVVGDQRTGRVWTRSRPNSGTEPQASDLGRPIVGLATDAELYAAATATEIRIHEASGNRGSEVRPLRGEVRTIALRGGVLVSGSSQGSVDLWRVSDRTMINLYQAPPGVSIQKVDLSSDASRALAVTSDGDVLAWNLKIGPVIVGVSDEDLPGALRKRTTVCLTEQQRRDLLGEDPDTAVVKAQRCAADNGRSSSTD